MSLDVCGSNWIDGDCPEASTLFARRFDTCPSCGHQLRPHTCSHYRDFHTGPCQCFCGKKMTTNR